jgi:glycosyltransferase involved in cell wall biosynthesis
MRIVNAMFGRGRGGLEKVFIDYCEALTRAGHEVRALIHPHAAIRPVLEARQMPFDTLGNGGAWDPVAMLRLHLRLKNLAPEITIAHGNRAISLLKGAAARPLIGVAANYTLKCDGLDGIFCATQDLVRHCRGRGAAAERISLIPHAVDAPAAPPQRIRHQPPVVGAMGRFVGKKGFDVLIEALHRLLASNVAFRAVIAGDGDEGPALQRLVRRHGLDRIVEFPGWQEDKTAFFRRIDVFCLPSLHEPFGIVLLEAMAEGLPVIATDSEGPSEILRDPRDGMIVPRANPVALAEAIGRVLGDPQAASAMGLRGYETVCRDFNLPLLSRRLDAALCAIAGVPVGDGVVADLPDPPAESGAPIAR